MKTKLNDIQDKDKAKPCLPRTFSTYLEFLDNVLLFK